MYGGKQVKIYRCPCCRLPVRIDPPAAALVTPPLQKQILKRLAQRPDGMTSKNLIKHLFGSNSEEYRQQREHHLNVLIDRIRKTLRASGRFDITCTPAQPARPVRLSQPTRYWLVTRHRVFGRPPANQKRMAS